MFQIRIHGRGGQGVVSAAEMLSVAAFNEDKHTQAFPSFGSERMGAPVMSFCRIADREIRLREPVLEPDCLIVQDTTLLHQADLFAGLKPGGFLIINTPAPVGELGIDEILDALPNGHVCTLPANEISARHLGRPRPNAVLLGAFTTLTGRVTLESLCQAITEKFPGPIGTKNAAAAREAAESITLNA